MNKNQDQELDYRMDSVSENVSENASEKVSENVSDARLSQIFGEALGDEPSKEETLAAWEALDTTILSAWSVAVCPGRISTSVPALLTFTLPCIRVTFGASLR